MSLCTLRHRAATALAWAALAALALAPAGCARDRAGNEPADERLPVRVHAAERRPLVRTITLSGRLQASERVGIRPEVSGRILAFHRREGDAVEAGDLLVELDPTQYRLELERSEAALAQAEARLDDAQRELARTRELFERDIVSQAALDRAGIQARIARADRKTALANRNLAAQRLEDTRIAAPIPGVLQDRRVSVGDIVGPSFGAGGASDGEAASGGSAGAAPIFTLIQIDPLHVEFNVAEQDLPYLRASAEPVPLRVDVLPGREWQGVVDYVAPSLDPRSHTQLVRLRIDNPDGRLKPGMFARMEGTREVAESGLVIRADSLVNLGGRYGAYVVNGSGHARLRPVEVAFVTGNQAAILEGLEAGDPVVFEGQGGLRDGAAVRVVEPNRPEGTDGTEARS